MRRALIPLAIATLACAVGMTAVQPARAGPAQAQVTIYRCTDDAGRVALRDSPCRAGQEQTVRNMLKPKDAPPAPLLAPAAVAPPAPTAAAPRIVVVRPPQPMYECTTPEGERYSSDTADGNPRWVPLWTLGWPVQADGARDSLAITGGSIRIDDSGARVVPPLPRPAWPASAGTWIRDRCRQLAPTEACARLRDRRDEIRHRFFNAQPSERDVLRIERRGLLARLDADCA